MFQCLHDDKEPLYNYFWKCVQKKTQTPNFSEDMAIRKCIAGLLPGQLASCLSTDTTLNVPYTQR